MRPPGVPGLALPLCTGDTRGVPARAVGRCNTCGREQPTWNLITCPVCGQVSCHKCAKFAYGRHFCSDRCAQYFFHAEPDEDEQEPDGG
jgi:hypothetical protein